eukprot:1161776-Pelagomonas_calceolata.AAC.5
MDKQKEPGRVQGGERTGDSKEQSCGPGLEQQLKSGRRTWTKQKEPRVQGDVQGGERTGDNNEPGLEQQGVLLCLEAPRTKEVPTQEPG